MKAYSIILKVLVIAAITQFGTSCDNPKRGNGEIIFLDRDMPNFDHIEIRGNYEVELVPSEYTKLVIGTDDNLQDYIKAEVRNSTLFIDTPKPILSRQAVKVAIFYNQINGLTSSGASVISSARTIKTDHLDLKFPGAGSVNLEIETERLSVQIPGAGLVKLVGYANQQDIEISGAGSLNAVNLVSMDTKIRLNGVGNAEVNVRSKLDAEINGIGSIKYRGKPKEIRQEVRGLGTIKEVNE